MSGADDECSSASLFGVFYFGAFAPDDALVTETMEAVEERLWARTFIGGMASGWVVDHFTTNGVKDWQSIWLTFAGYALILGIVFPLVFKYRHDPEKMVHISPAHSAG